MRQIFFHAWHSSDENEISTIPYYYYYYYYHHHHHHHHHQIWEKFEGISVAGEGACNFLPTINEIVINI
jgi:hypothetical protein